MPSHEGSLNSDSKGPSRGSTSRMHTRDLVFDQTRAAMGLLDDEDIDDGEMQWLRASRAPRVRTAAVQEQSLAESLGLSAQKSRVYDMTMEDWAKIPEVRDRTVKRRERQVFMPRPDSLLVDVASTGTHDLTQSAKSQAKTQDLLIALAKESGELSTDDASKRDTESILLDQKRTLRLLMNRIRAETPASVGAWEQLLRFYQEQHLFTEGYRAALKAVQVHPQEPSLWLLLFSLARPYDALQAAQKALTDPVLSRSELIWRAAIHLEPRQTRPNLVLKALKAVPHSAAIWELALADPPLSMTRRELLQNAVDNAPSLPNLWLQLIDIVKTTDEVEAAEIATAALDRVPLCLPILLVWGELQASILALEGISDTDVIVEVASELAAHLERTNIRIEAGAISETITNRFPHVKELPSLGLLSFFLLFSSCENLTDTQNLCLQLAKVRLKPKASLAKSVISFAIDNCPKSVRNLVPFILMLTEGQIKSISPLMQLASHLYRVDGLPEEALSLLSVAIDRKPSPAVYGAVAEVYAEMGRIDQAVEIYSQENVVISKVSIAVKAIGFLKQHHAPQWRTLLQTARKHFPQEAALIELEMEALKTDADRATLLDSALANDPSNLGLVVLRARLFATMGKAGRARMLLQRLERSHGSSEIYWHCVLDIEEAAGGRHFLMKAARAVQLCPAKSLFERQIAAAPERQKMALTKAARQHFPDI